ncbi:MAG: hypothetical protein RMI63_05405 [Caldimicrobium sp.]|nr:hypothetical protein [Caldimicrobium sp.]
MSLLFATLSKGITAVAVIIPFYIYLLYWPLLVMTNSPFLIGALYYTVKNFKVITKDEKLLLLSKFSDLHYFYFSRSSQRILYFIYTSFFYTSNNILFSKA